MSQELCIKALQKMPVSFSSTRFSKQLRKWNADPSFISNGIMFKFLLQNCQQDGMRSWSKKREIVKELPMDNIDLEKAIQIVKNSGQYKVYKLQQEWKEI
jgi:hypothetical protein